MKVNTPVKEEYINRYNEKFIFSKLNNKEILWEGEFSYCRFGFPNNYTLAYDKYIEGGGDMDMEEFQHYAHEYNEELGEYVLNDEILKLISPNRNIINMVDPSGGPYLRSGMNMGYISNKLKNMIINRFIPINGNYKIICE